MKKLFFFLNLFLILMTGCAGYQLASEEKSIFSDSSKTLKIRGVDYPTLDVELPYIIRNEIRDEINARHMATWVDSGFADYEMQINVVSYTSREWSRSRHDQTELYDTVLTMEAIIYKGNSSTEVWRSGRVSYSERDDSSASTRQSLLAVVSKQLVRQIVDKMYNAF